MKAAASKLCDWPVMHLLSHVFVYQQPLHSISTSKHYSGPILLLQVLQRIKTKLQRGTAADKRAANELMMAWSLQDVEEVRNIWCAQVLYWSVAALWLLGDRLHC